MDLMGLREAAGKTQEELVEALSGISRIEGRSDYCLSTLSGMWPLAAALEMVASFGGRCVRLRAA